jgi:predicted RNase H-like nuclease (RuvC/YqgF family)
MTDDQKQLLAVFESKIHQLMSMYKALKEENTALKNELSEKSEMIQADKDNIEQLKLQYENLKIARVVSIRQDEITGAKKRLSKLVQEVDKCIALLNV